MNNKRTILILTLFLMGMPSLYAMRLTQAFSRLRAPLLAKVAQRFKQEKTYESAFSWSLPFAATLGVGSLLAAAQEPTTQEEATEHVSIHNLNYQSTEHIINALRHASEDDKHTVANHLAKHITHIKIDNLLKIVSCAQNRAHRILVTAIADNITAFSQKDICTLLQQDQRNITHHRIAHALKKHYKNLVSYTCFGMQLYSNRAWQQDYIRMAHRLTKEYQSVALEPVLHEIEKYNVVELLRIAKTDDQKQTILTAFAQSSSVQLDAYQQSDLQDLFKISKPFNQQMIAQAFADNIQAYNGWHFYGIFKECTDESKELIINAIAQHLETADTFYDSNTIMLILEQSNQEQKSHIATSIIERTKRAYPYLYKLAKKD